MKPGKLALEFDSALVQRAQSLRALLLDVDGVLTDGGLHFGADGEQIKRFNTLDGHGLKLLGRAGIRVGIISGRDGAALRARLSALGLKDLALGVQVKKPAAEAMLSAWQLSWAQTAAMGDDWPDLPLMHAAAMAFAPPNAHAEVQAVAQHVTRQRGGEGAVREVCDLLLQASGQYARLLQEDAELGTVHDSAHAVSIE